jgi:3-methylfumaryl-CoA hydratase
MTKTVKLEEINQWTGRTQFSSDRITLAPVHALRATLDLQVMPLEGTELRLPWHWMYFSSPARAEDVDVDGHPKRGGFLPPIPLPRRMWAGGRLEIIRSLIIGEEVLRKSTIKSVNIKEGRSGTLVFVTVLHEISDKQGLAIMEEQDLVYRDVPLANAGSTHLAKYSETASHSRQVTPNPVLLFRYSALTFNGHRIHYDRNYATSVEGYPALVVHGPLIATLLLDLLTCELPQANVCHFSFKAVSPLFDIHTFSLNMKAETDGRLKLWALNHKGELAMAAEAQLA